MAEMIWVEVVLALPEVQHLRRLTVPVGTNAQQALAFSRLPEEFPDFFKHAPTLGIFSKKISPDTVLNAEDRIEIYRPLLIDPKENRRLRSQKKNDHT